MRNEVTKLMAVKMIICGVTFLSAFLAIIGGFTGIDTNTQAMLLAFPAGIGLAYSIRYFWYNEDC